MFILQKKILIKCIKALYYNSFFSLSQCSLREVIKIYEPTLDFKFGRKTIEKFYPSIRRTFFIQVQTIYLKLQMPDAHVAPGLFF